MVETLVSFYHSEESLPIQGICAKSRSGPARAHWEQYNRSVASLQNIFVEGLELSGPFQENIRQFVAARQLSDHSITTSVWRKYW